MGERLDLFSLSVARRIRTGADSDSLAKELGLSKQNLSAITATYDGVPSSMLGAIERLLRDREKLRSLIARLLPP